MTTKNGKIKLGKNDYRVGNFVLTTEGDGKYIKVTDISSLCTHRYDTTTPKGTFLRILIEEKADEMIQNYVTVMFNVLLVVPDLEFLEAVNGAAVECLKRHTNLYGVNEYGEEEEAKILDEQQAVQEIIEGLEKDGLTN